MWSWFRNEQVCSSQIPCSSMKVFPRRLNSNRTKKSHKSRGFSDTLVETLSGHYCRVERRRLPQPQMLSDAFLAPWLAENKVCFASFSCSSETLVRVIFFFLSKKKKKKAQTFSQSVSVCVFLFYLLCCVLFISPKRALRSWLRCNHTRVSSFQAHCQPWRSRTGWWSWLKLSSEQVF